MPSATSLSNWMSPRERFWRIGNRAIMAAEKTKVAESKKKANAVGW